MRNALKHLRNRRTMLNRAICALEELEKLQAGGEQPQQTSSREAMPGRLIVIRGGVHSKTSRPPHATLERPSRSRLK